VCTYSSFGNLSTGKNEEEILRFFQVDPARATPEVRKQLLINNPWLREANDLMDLNQDATPAPAPANPEPETA